METKKIIEKYSDNLPLKLIIQNIPYIGSSLNTILSETGNKWREKRIETLIQIFDEKIKAIEISDQAIISKMEQKVSSENSYDLFIQAGQKSTMTYKKENISRFANILKNYIIKEISYEDYLVEIFLDISDNLSDHEISLLSKQYQAKKLEIYYSNYTNKPFDIERMKKDISERKLELNFQSIPEEYYFSDYFLYFYNRLEKLDLISIEIGHNSGGHITVGWSTQYQSMQSQLPYKRKDEVIITDFGKKYIDWVMN